MKPAPFTFHAPTTLEAAVALLGAKDKGETRILAGGQSLVPTMALRLARPDCLIDINRVAGLDRVASEDGRLKIGATVRHARFHDSGGLGTLGPILAHVARYIAHYPIRQRGTFCGSLAHADPASEWCLVTATFDGVMSACSTAGRRDIPVGDFFQGVMTTTLEPDEILIEASLVQPAVGTTWAFEEFSMRAGDFAVAMALVAFEVADGKIVHPRIGVGGVEPFARRIAEAEAALAGLPPSPDAFARAGDAASAAVDPIDDWQADAGERRGLTGALVRRALCKAAGENG